MSFRKVSHLRIGVSSNSVQFDTSTILDDFLFLGAKGVTANLEQLTRENITNVINCSSEPDTGESPYPPGFAYLHIQVDDNAGADIGQYFDQCCDFIEAARRRREGAGEAEGNAVLVHCTMGMSRSATIVLAYLVKCCDMDLAKAFDFVKMRRPVASPNPGFMAQLVQFEIRTRGKATIDASKYDAKSRFEDAKNFII